MSESKPTRSPGYYWVRSKRSGRVVIGLWSEGAWLFAGRVEESTD